MSSSEPTFAELLARCSRSAVHLEMRDQYGVSDESEGFRAWLRTGQRDTDPASETWAPWVELISRAVARGVVVRRARIISEPVTDYIRYEHGGTVVNVTAGAVFGVVATLSRKRTAGEALIAMMRAEAGKVALIVVQLWLVLTYYKPLLPGPFFGTFVLTVIFFSMAIFVRDR